MDGVDAAEKEASEVLHSLLSVERIEKPEMISEDCDSQQNAFHTGNNTSVESTDGDGEGDRTITWHTPVPISEHPLFRTDSSSGEFEETMDEQQVVIWNGETIQVENPEHDHELDHQLDAELDAEQENISDIYNSPLHNDIDDGDMPDDEMDKDVFKSPPTPPPKKKLVKKKKNGARLLGGHHDPTKLEESSVQVKDRFRRGCECQDESCFRGLNPDNVYKHRLNIAELTKGEHDMYLMGVTMACLANPDTTVRHKERRRLRAQYVYQGRRVCLDAFLYLENCTHYQLKRIRKHVMTHGVAPRVHGNHGKKPHNTFSLDIYKHATEFLKQYLEQYTGEFGIGTHKQPIALPWDITRKNLHDAYREYGQILEPGIKLMGYSTFRHFMKEQFQHVRFCKVEPKANVPNATTQTPQVLTQEEVVTVIQPQFIKQERILPRQVQVVEQSQPQQQVQHQVQQLQQVIPLVVATTPQQNDGNVTTTQHQHHQQAFIVTPMLPNGNVITTQNGNVIATQNGNVITTQNGNVNHTGSNTFSYQLTNTGYVINDQGNIVTTMANAQHHAPYTFNRI